MSIARDRPVGREGRHFCRQQTALDKSVDNLEAIGNHITADDGFKVGPGGLTFSPVHISYKRDESQEGRDPIGTTAGARGPHAWNFDCAARPHGTAGTVPDIDPILESMLEKTTSPSWEITAITDDKTFTVDITTGAYDAPEAGDVVGIPISLGSSQVEAAVIASVTTVSEVTTIVLEHDLSFTPDAETVIALSVQYFPRNDVDTDKFFTLKEMDGGVDQSYSGCILDALTLAASRGASAQLSLSGFARHHFGFGQTTLAAELDDAAGTTSMTLTDYSTGWGIDSDNPVFVEIEDEIIKITAINSTTSVATIVREQKDTSAATHADGTAVVFWDVEPSYNGVPISGVINTCQVEGTYYGADEMSFSTVEGVEPHENMSDEELQAFIYTKKREASLAITLTGYKSDFGFLGVAVHRDAYRFVLQYGNQQGKTCVIHCKSVEINPVVLPADQTGKISIPISSDKILDTGDNDNGWSGAII